MKHATVIPGLLLLSVGLALAASTPPDALNYQGVLRNSSDQPLDGTYGMIFRFFDSESGGDEILVDTHGTVTVSGGVFNVRFGGGSVTDGSGPGEYTTVSRVMATYSDLYLEVQVAAETLSPRIRILSTGYALNTRYVRGVEIVSDGPLDLYVDGLIGDDLNDGLSPDAAKQTIQAAVSSIPSILRDSVTVHVADGTYHETIVVGGHSRDGLHSIDLVGNPSAPDLVVLDGESTRDNAIWAFHDFVLVSGMTFTNYAEPLMIYEGTMRVENSVLTGNADAAVFVFLGEVEVVSTRIENNVVGLAAVQSRVSLFDCQITGNSEDGIELESSVLLLEQAPLDVSNNAWVGIRSSQNSQVELYDEVLVTILNNSGGDMQASYQSAIRGYGNGTTGACTADSHSTCEP